MGSLTLSSVLEELIHSLCLNDFPCGRGSWSKTKGKEHSWGYVEQDEGREGADKEEQDALIDLLTCPHSPWQHKGSWSPEATALRVLSVQTPERLDENFIFNYFRTLRIVDKGVSVIDGGLLKFSNLEELVLSANNISELPLAHLPCSLRILELYANQVSNLNSLSHHQLPDLQYLGLGSNGLGSHEDIRFLTGKHWPKLVSLDLGGCEFQVQQALVNALTTLPCLRTLVLEGNPLTLAPSYPGFTLDSLPGLFYLDASQITPEQRHHFRGLAKMSDLVVDRAAATVSVRRIRGIPDPHMTVDGNTPDFPVVTYSYFVTYEFPSHQASLNKRAYCESISDTVEYMKEDGSPDVDQQSNKDEGEMSATDTLKPDITALRMDTEDNSHDMTAEVPVAKPSQAPKEKKRRRGKEAPNKVGANSAKGKSKDKKKPVMDLVQDAPIRRVLGSVHVPLHNLLKGSQKVDILCDLGVLLTEPSVRAMGTLEKDPAKKSKEAKEKKLKPRGDSADGQRNKEASKGKAKGRKERDSDVQINDTAPVQPEPMTVEFSVQLEKWQSASEAHQLLPHSAS
ncbi:leucine-rich repeat-containing protein 43-like [Diretmus argenteus]